MNPRAREDRAENLGLAVPHLSSLGQVFELPALMISQTVTFEVPALKGPWQCISESRRHLVFLCDHWRSLNLFSSNPIII